MYIGMMSKSKKGKTTIGFFEYVTSLLISFSSFLYTGGENLGVLDTKRFAFDTGIVGICFCLCLFSNLTYSTKSHLYTHPPSTPPTPQPLPSPPPHPSRRSFKNSSFPYALISKCVIPIVPNSFSGSSPASSSP